MTSSRTPNATQFMLGIIAVMTAILSPASAQTSVPTLKPLDLTKTPTLYMVGYSHLDTEWCWSYPQVIDEFIPNTLHQNFTLFEKYPDYVFNWTGANRYKFIKEYYPADFAKLKTYVAAGRWYPDGSSLEEGDVDIPSEESIIRQVMYGNEFFRNEFGVAASDFMLPDCFGFPASLPSILAHCGIKGFSTQKLSWGSAVGIPFNVGVWEGTDGQTVFAALNGGSYDSPINGDLSRDEGWAQRIASDGATSGIYADFGYYGVGDRGGSVRDSDAANLEQSLSSGGSTRIIPARADQLFNDLANSDTSRLPRYKGDLLLTQHTSGSTTSEAEMKRWNHENEKLADATERASVIADWIGAAPYDKARITDAWWKFLPGQFHDLMAGTALPRGYEFAWNDQVLAMNEFAGVLNEAVGGTTRALDTTGAGIPVVVYNPLSFARQEVVPATLTFPSSPPSSLYVVGPDGKICPSQIETRNGNTTKILILASVPSVGYATYHVRQSADKHATTASTGLAVGQDFLENRRYTVRLNAAGDVESIFDKLAQRNLLTSPLRLAFQYENPSEWPAWNMDWSDQSKSPEGYVDGPAKVSIVERGPLRVALQVDRWARGSHFVETIQLSSGKTGDRVEFLNQIDWKSKECALMAVAPLAVSNPLATYNWEPGTIQRANDDPAKYEVPSHQWFDVTNPSHDYGVSFLTGDRYGSDKPNDNTIRLTLLYTPGVRGGYTHQATQDWGHHDLRYAIEGHQGDWSTAGTQDDAMSFDKPMVAFQATSHVGVLGKSFSFVHTNNSNVSIEALKQAEMSSEVVVRFNELSGQPQSAVHCHFAAPLRSAREIDGQEKPVGSAEVVDGDLVFDMEAYRPRAFAVTLAAPTKVLTAPQSHPVALAYNVNVTKPFGSASGGSFDADGNAIPSDMLQASITSNGVTFSLANTDGSVDNAVECRGQRVTLPNANGGCLSLIAASDDGDRNVSFGVAGRSVIRTIQAWNGMIGQWDDRVWGGVVPELTYEISNPVIGLKPGFIKRDPVAWYSDHLRASDGSNQAYSYCYLFRYAIDVPQGCISIQLPDNAHVKILAATLSDDPNAGVIPAEPLYDTLIHSPDKEPRIEIEPTPDGSRVTANINAPLYFSSDASIHYTLDGSTPTAQSYLYTTPIELSQSATIKAAYCSADATVEGTGATTVHVDKPSPPHVTSIIAVTSSKFKVTFSEAVTKTSAEEIRNYSFSPPVTVDSASLRNDGVTVIINTTTPHAPNMLTISAVRSAVSNGLSIVAPETRLLPDANVIVQLDDAMTFNKASDGYNSPRIDELPTSAKAPWTINFYAYINSPPQAFMSIAGFGSNIDTTGTQRYLAQFPHGIHFWGSNVDVDAGAAYDFKKWQMITATYDGQVLSLYKNGTLLKTAAIQLTDSEPYAKVAPNAPWATDRFKGKIAGFRIWNVSLSADQVMSLMQKMPNN